MTIRPLHFLVTMVLPMVCAAQNTGTLRLLVDPGHNFEFVLDRQYRMQQREVKLGEGLHHFAFWAPERMIVDTNVFVVADRTTDFVLKLPYSPEYMQYRQELAKYETKRRVARTIPTIVTGAGLAWVGLSYAKYQKARDVLEKDKETYDIDVVPGSIRTLKDQTIPQHNEDLRSARTGLYTSIGFTAVAAGVTYFFYRRSTRWERPTLNDKQKVLFEGLTWVPTRNGGFFHAGITIPLAR